jgi:DNA-directed RNA polymerase specialized sigma24 family protein
MSATSLASQLDQHQEIATRSAALAELARDGQDRIDRFFRKRGVADADDRADLNATVWETVARKVLHAEFDAERCQAEISYVLGIATLVLQHYRSRDRRLIGQIVTLDTNWDISEECSDLAEIEETLDRDSRYQCLIERLDEDSRAIAHEIWTNGYNPAAIAAALGRNIKTIRARIRVIAEQLKVILAEENA